MRVRSRSKKAAVVGPGGLSSISRVSEGKFGIERGTAFRPRLRSEGTATLRAALPPERPGVSREPTDTPSGGARRPAVAARPRV